MAEDMKDKLAAISKTREIINQKSIKNDLLITDKGGLEVKTEDVPILLTYSKSIDLDTNVKSMEEELLKFCKQTNSEMKSIYPICIVNDVCGCGITISKLPIGDIKCKHSNWLVKVEMEVK